MGVHGPAPREADYTIWITDHNLTPISQQIDTWESLSVTLRYNEVSNGEFTTQADPELVAAARTPMARTVVERDGQILISGPIEYTPYRYSAEEDGIDGLGMLTVRFADDLALVAGRISYPNPALPATGQDVARWTFTDSAENLMRALVNSNAGPAAMSARRIPRLVLGPTTGVTTPTVEWSTRFQPLCDDLRGISNVAGGRVGFRTRQVGDLIEFQVYTPRDLTDRIWFARSLGNLESIEHEPEAPKATIAICGGQDAGVSRVIAERGTPGDWWRLEMFVDDAGASNLAELQAAGDDELAANAEVQRLAVVAYDIDGQRFGVDYDLGDLVAVEAYPGLPDVPDIIAAVEITATPEEGERIKPVIGIGSAALLDPYAAERRDILRKLARRGATVEIPL